MEPGLTNAVLDKNGQRIVGFNTESQEINEGLARFDIVFYVRTKDGLSQIIINVEAQKDEPGEYEILNRAIFYVSRLVSSQKERDFENSRYDDIKRVYSIWVCMNIPIEENMRKDVSAMCNLGEGIEEKGIAIGREKGRIEGRIEGEAGLILKMYKNGLSAEQIASATDKPLEEVKEIIAGI